MLAKKRIQRIFILRIRAIRKSSTAEFYVPGDDIPREPGLMQIRHSHLDHTLRLAIKRMLGISIDNEGYWNETRGMSAELRKRAGELIAERCSNDMNTAFGLVASLLARGG
jgi:hypothetical protein